MATRYNFLDIMYQFVSRLARNVFLIKKLIKSKRKDNLEHRDNNKTNIKYINREDAI